MDQALGVGAGLRPAYFAQACARDPRIELWEVLTENVMIPGGNPRRVVRGVREHTPIALHGVSLSIGSADPLSDDYVARLRALVDELEPAFVSDHLCWTTIDGRSGHDLWPLPYTDEALAHVIARVGHVQERLGRRILLENPATYVRFAAGDIPEAGFLAELAARSGCGVLLDINNVHVTATNLGADPGAYLAALPPGCVEYMHLAGHSRRGDTLIDSHDRPICEATWQLYAAALARFGPVPTVIERDDRIPPLDELAHELARARDARAATRTVPGSVPSPREHERSRSRSLASQQRAFYEHVTAGAPCPAIVGTSAIYAEMYDRRLADALGSSFPQLRACLGDMPFESLARRYVRAHPPHSFTLRELGRELSAFLRTSDVPPWAAELAALELARLDAFDGPDDAPLTRADTAALEPAALAVLRLRWVAASRRIPSVWDLRAHAELVAVPARVLLIWRRGFDVCERVLDEDEAVIAAMLERTAALDELAAEIGDAERVAQLLARWIDDGAVVRVDG